MFRIPIILLIFIPQLALAEANLRELWSIKGVFSSPESAVYDPQRKQIYMSNVNGYAKDGNGFISRISASGELLELKWLDGLNSPTGITIHMDHLYVVDYDELLVIDLDTKEVILRAASPDAKPALNDVVVSPTGDAFVSGSASSSIYLLRDTQLEVWQHDPGLLRLANGLFVDGERLVVGGASWLAFDIATRQQQAAFTLTGFKIADFDGITQDGCGNFIVSLLNDKRLWQIDEAGRAKVLSELPINAIDMHFYRGKLYTAIVGDGVAAYQLASECQQAE